MNRFITFIVAVVSIFSQFPTTDSPNPWWVCHQTPNGPPKDLQPNEAVEQDDADFAPNRVCGLPSMLEAVGRCCDSMGNAGSKDLFQNRALFSRVTVLWETHVGANIGFGGMKHDTLLKRLLVRYD
jgi:hypothetical protein